MEARPWGMNMRSFLILLHLSQFGGYLVPMAGWLLPLIMWLTNREEFPEIDRHGKMIMNWIISSVIYGFVGFVLTFVLIGIPLLIALGIMMVVFPIVGAIKADGGEFWTYPLTLRIIP